MKFSKELYHKCDQCGRQHLSLFDSEAEWDIQINHNTVCIDCGNLCVEEYRVHDEVWKSAGLLSSDGVLHLTCLEKKLNRKLTLSDFPKIPFNGSLLFGFSMGSNSKTN